MILFLASAVLAQTPELKPVHPRQAMRAVNEKPVTAREARETFVRVAGLLQKVHTPPLGATSIPAVDRPATREEIVAEMARIFTAAEPAFRFTPAPTAYDASKLRIAPLQKSALARLIQRGCVARIGPLAVGPQAGLTPKQFGDAVGFFMARIAQMAHMPSSKFTPMLQKE